MKKLLLIALLIAGCLYGKGSNKILSRENRLTSIGLAQLLYRMNYHRYSQYYFSSLSLYGIRGTLQDKNYNANLYGKFLGKTGTLDNVRTLSGILNKNKKLLYISILANSIENDDPLIFHILDAISRTNCGTK